MVYLTHSKNHTDFDGNQWSFWLTNMVKLQNEIPLEHTPKYLTLMNVKIFYVFGDNRVSKLAKTCQKGE